MLPLVYISLSQFIFAALLVFTKPKRQAPDFILGYWLALMALFLGLVIVEQYHFGGVNLELFPFAYTLGPFLYLYVDKLTSPKAHIQEKDLAHLVPFAIICLVAALTNHGIDDHFVEGNIFSNEITFYSISVILHVLIYAILSFQRLRRHQKNILNIVSYQSANISLQWLYMTVLIFIGTFLFTFIFLLLNYFFPSKWLNPAFPFFIGLCIFAYMISFFGARQTSIFSIKQHTKEEEIEIEAIENEDIIEEILIEEEPKIERYANSGLSKEFVEKYQKQLILYFETEKPFKLRELNAQMVAKQLDIKQHHLTEVMNEYMGKNFYTFVNEYRVAEVIKMLKNRKFDHYSLLGIAYEAGFNSKSSFNTIFKKITGLTPTEYKTSLEKENPSD
jgi:AraC-like DNA-binding protein